MNYLTELISKTLHIDYKPVIDDKFLYDRVEKLQLMYNIRAIRYLIENKHTPAPWYTNTPEERRLHSEASASSARLWNTNNLEMYDWVMINIDNIDNCNEVGIIFYIDDKNMYMYIFDLGVMPLIKNNVILNPISSICKNSYLLSIKQLHKEIKDYKIKKNMINITNLVLNKKLNKNIFWM
jgi:hypothetical protein